AVGVGGNSNLHARFTCQTGILRREIQPVRTRIDFEETPAPPGMINDSTHIQFVTGTLQKQSAGRMSENVEVAIIHRSENALRMFLLPKTKSRMHRANGVIEFLQNLV